MANDVYEMIRERDMLDLCTFICLDYEEVKYMEDTYPEARTGYLCFYSYGAIQDLDCDILILEEETATDTNISRIHAAGKEVYVWTCNTEKSIRTCILHDVDGTVTDTIELAEETKETYGSRGDLYRVLYRLADFMG